MAESLDSVLGQNTDSALYLKSLSELKFNPAGIQSLALGSLEKALNGEVSFIDATSPLTALVGISSMNTAGFIIENEALDRRSYPNLARTKEELYHHISDKDYLNCFASPTRDKFTVVINMKELESKMVPDAFYGGKVVTIPRFSSTTVLDTTFTLMHSVHIRKMVSGGYSVSYDTSKPSPLHPLTTNTIEASVRMNAETQIEFMRFEIEMVQVSARSIKSDVNVATGFNKAISFEDQFCAARVYYRNNSTAGWSEMQVTLSEFVYDRSKPTAVLQVLDGVLNVRIPGIYFTDRIITGSVRVDVFSTKGAVSLNTQSLAVTDFISVWSVLVDEDKSSAVTAWQAMQEKAVYNSTVIAGGSNELTFEELRERVIANAVGQQSLPITPPQIKAALQQDGFTLVAHTDTVTETEFLATKEMPVSFDSQLITAGNASINSIVASFAQFVQNPLVKDNGDRITLVPEVLYEEDNGIISMVSPATLQNILANDLERVAQIVSQRQFLFTPFHYVLDATNDSFAVRPYHLTSPSAEAGIFVGNNPTTGMNVVTSGFTINHTAQGFELVLSTKGNAAWRALDNSQMHAQLVFQPSPAEPATYFLAEVAGRDNNGDATFVFKLDNTFDIDAQDRLILKTGKLLNLNDRDTAVALDQTFGLMYSSSAAMPGTWVSSSLDMALGSFMLPNRIAAVSHERVIVHFGKRLQWLWSKGRTISGTGVYQTWEEDIPLTYSENVYETDATGSPIKFDEQGQPVMTILHAAGEIVRDQNNQIVYLHRRGDVKLVGGQPVPVRAADVSRQVPIFFLEGVYFFATDYSSTRYLKEMVATVVDWITDNIDRLQPSLLQRTSVYFCPKTTRGTIEVFNESGNRTTVQAAQSLNIKAIVPPAVYMNEQIRSALTKSSIQIISEHLKKETVSRSAMTSELRAIYGNDVISFSLSGLGGVRNFDSITMVSEGDRCSIAKVLVALPSGELAVSEDVTVDFSKQAL